MCDDDEVVRATTTTTKEYAVGNQSRGGAFIDLFGCGLMHDDEDDDANDEDEDVHRGACRGRNLYRLCCGLSDWM